MDRIEWHIMKGVTAPGSIKDAPSIYIYSGGKKKYISAG
jgi:hypothetical protein